MLHGFFKVFDKSGRAANDSAPFLIVSEDAPAAQTDARTTLVMGR